MATFRKRGKKIYAEISVHGRRKSKSFDTKTEAKIWAAEAERLLRIETEKGIDTTLTVEDMLKRYQAEVSPQKKGARWESIRIDLLLRDKLSEEKLSEIKPTHIADWRDRRLKDVKSSTVNRELNLLSNAFQVARKEWHWIEASPVTDVKRPKDPPHRDRRITDEEIEMMCVALGFNGEIVTKSSRVGAAFLFAIETAMRRSEICGIKRESIQGRVAHLPKTKNGQARQVPLSKRALELLEIVDYDFGLQPDQLTALFNRATKKTPIKNLTFHDTRHEAITRLAKKVDVLDLARIVGHRDIKMLMTYYNKSAEDIADELD